MPNQKRLKFFCVSRNEQRFIIFHVLINNDVRAFKRTVHEPLFQRVVIYPSSVEPISAR